MDTLKFHVQGKFTEEHKNALDALGATILTRKPSLAGDRVSIVGNAETITRVNELLRNSSLFQGKAEKGRGIMTEAAAVPSAPPPPPAEA